LLEGVSFAIFLVIPQTPSDDGLQRVAHPRWGERMFVLWSRVEGGQTPTLSRIELNLGSLRGRFCVKVARRVQFTVVVNRLCAQQVRRKRDRCVGSVPNSDNDAAATAKIARDRRIHVRSLIV